MTIETVIAPAFEPVSLVEARRWLGLEVDDSDHTAVLTMLIKAMREYAENLTQRAFVTRTLRLTLERWPADTRYGALIELPFPPLQSVSLFRYRDSDGAAQTLAADQYSVYTHSEPGFVIPAPDVTWPTIDLLPDAVQLTYLAGYAPGSPPDEPGSQETLPAAVKLWMQARLATLFENREQLISGTIVNALPRDFVDGLLDALVLARRLF